MVRGLILVSYYAHSIDEIRRLVDCFDKEVGYEHQWLLVVDNAGVLPVGMDHGRRRIEVVRGSNSAWEFSGWLEGLTQFQNGMATTITLLNDSYLRNWNLTAASRGLVRSMYKAAERGFIAGWMDNFSWFQRPLFSRRPNSRLVVVPNTGRDLMAYALAQAINRCRFLVEQAQPLFDEDEMTRLHVWFASQPRRWAPETLPTRLQRIFLEHHIFDSVPDTQLLLFPRTLVNSFLYAVSRRLFRERR